MNTRTVKTQSSGRTVAVLLVAVFLVQAVGGCVSTEATKPVTGPGTPDAMQLKHYEMLKAAIQAQSRRDSLAALALLQSDVSRWHTDVLTLMNAMVDQAALTDIVEKEDWDLAHKKFLNLTAKYRYGQ